LNFTFRSRWSAHLETKNHYPIQQLLDLVANKLTGTFKDSSMQPSGRSALLCSRLLIHHTQNQAGRDLSKTLVASHLSFAYMTSEDRSILNSGYPPEPFVSAAAVRKMPVDYNTWVSWLKDMVISDYISRGDRGELISRVLLTIARDLAWRDDEMKWIQDKKHRSTWKLTLESVLPGHEPVSVCNFLKYYRWPLT